MQGMLNNPEVIDQIVGAASQCPDLSAQACLQIAQSPELRALGPQARQIMQSSMFREMLTNPQALQMAMQAAGRGGFPGMPGGGAPGSGAQQPGLFGLAQQQQQGGGSQGPNAAAAGGANAMPDFSSLFGQGSPFGQLPTPGSPTSAGQQPNMQALMDMLGGAGAGGFGGLGGAPGGTAPAPAANAGPPPEERFADQLTQVRCVCASACRTDTRSQLAGIGFTNARQNVRALLATGVLARTPKCSCCTEVSGPQGATSSTRSITCASNLEFRTQSPSR